MKIALLFVLGCVYIAAAFPQNKDNHIRLARSPDDEEDDGGWLVKADKTNDGGTVVRVEAQKKWDVTDDGKVQAEVHGHWEGTFGGPSDGQIDHGVGGSIGGSWGK